MTAATSPTTAAKTAEDYVARGWKVIPVPAGEKGPRDSDWQTRTYDPKQFNGHNVGVQLGPVSRGLTDIDLDCPEAVALATHFLPSTGAVFGRASKPRSHYLYLIADPEPKAVVKLTDEKGKTIIEMRMGGGGKGAQTVFPGSVHPEGEKIEWASAGDPASTTCAVLKDAITKIAVASLLARHWPAHNRHDASLRCGGFLARSGWEPDTIDDFMRSVQMVAGVHDHGDIDNGCKAAHDAAEKHLEDGKGYGLPALIEFFNENVAKTIAKILAYNEVNTDDVLERMNEKYFVVALRSKARIGFFKFDPVIKRNTIVFHTVDDFKFLVDHPRIPTKKKKIGLGTWWLNNPLRRQYSGIVFQPGGAKVIDNDLNLWRGWGIEPKEGEWPLLRQHMFEVLVNGVDAHFEYLKRWTAWGFQNPALPAEVAVGLRGDQGTGKGVFGRALCRAYGEHGLQISSHSHLTGRFNAHQMGCAMMFADEAFWPGDKSAEGTLRRIISEPTIMIEMKRVDPIELPNSTKLLLGSNHEWLVPAALDERRFAMFDVSDKYAKNKAYFEPLYIEIANGGIAAMMWDLMRMDLQDWHPRYSVPKTTALMDQKYRSLAPELQWWVGLLMAGELPGPLHQIKTQVARNDGRIIDNWIPGNPRLAQSAALLEHVQKTVPQFRYLSEHRLGRLLREFGCDRASDYRIGGKRSWNFPVLAEARTAWDKRVGGETDWEPMEDWGHPDESM